MFDEWAKKQYRVVLLSKENGAWQEVEEEYYPTLAAVKSFLRKELQWVKEDAELEVSQGTSVDKFAAALGYRVEEITIQTKSVEKVLGYKDRFGATFMKKLKRLAESRK